MPTLHTSRLTLVPLADEHLELEYELDSDPAVMRYLTGRASTRDEVRQAHARRMATEPGFGFWMGFAGEEFVGWWLLRPPNGPDQPYVEGEAELGYRLLRRHWRQGYAREGSRELLRYGFEELGLDRIFAQTMAVNTPSRATMTSAGMTFKRAFISAAEYDAPITGADQGEVEYEITRNHWPEA
ncbi:GNAT family N-acetyltransferase [Amycolatopsis sp. NPDC004625]|uniref:GNAT family N-acetyltransferase n=1 Tax=Amycolatopsis sp. NPDC004625 TaxID=3154670 RepID=UPI0033A6090B